MISMAELGKVDDKSRKGTSTSISDSNQRETDHQPSKPMPIFPHREESQRGIYKDGCPMDPILLLPAGVEEVVEKVEIKRRSVMPRLELGINSKPTNACLEGIVPMMKTSIRLGWIGARRVINRRKRRPRGWPMRSRMCVVKDPVEQDSETDSIAIID